MSAAIIVQADPQQGEITGYSLWNPNTGQWQEQPPTLALGQTMGVRAYTLNTSAELQRMRVDFVVTALDRAEQTFPGQEGDVPAGGTLMWECTWPAEQGGTYTARLQLYGEPVELPSRWLQRLVWYPVYGTAEDITPETEFLVGRELKLGACWLNRSDQPIRLERNVWLHTRIVYPDGSEIARNYPPWEVITGIMFGTRVAEPGSGACWPLWHLEDSRYGWPPIPVFNQVGTYSVTTELYIGPFPNGQLMDTLSQEFRIISPPPGETLSAGQMVQVLYYVFCSQQLDLDFLREAYSRVGPLASYTQLPGPGTFANPCGWLLQQGYNFGIECADVASATEAGQQLLANCRAIWGGACGEGLLDCIRFAGALPQRYWPELYAEVELSFTQCAEAKMSAWIATVTDTQLQPCADYHYRQCQAAMGTTLNAYISYWGAPIWIDDFLEAVRSIKGDQGVEDARWAIENILGISL